MEICISCCYEICGLPINMEKINNYVNQFGSQSIKLTAFSEQAPLLVRAEYMRCPWAEGINVVATLNGIIAWAPK